MNNLLETLEASKNPEDNLLDYLAKFRGFKEFNEEIDAETFINKYFAKDSVPITEVFTNSHNDKWAKSFAAKPLWGIRVNPLDLDPFVARYVNAINAIGSKTISSCDGWHEHSNNVFCIIFKDRYSMIWHKLLFGLIEDKHGIEWEYKDHSIELKLPNSDEGKIEKYIALSKDAEYFELHQKELLDKKAKVIAGLKGLKKNALSNKENEEMISSKM